MHGTLSALAEHPSWCLHSDPFAVRVDEQWCTCTRVSWAWEAASGEHTCAPTVRASRC